MNREQITLCTTALFHEHKTLRDEIVATTAQFYSILQVGSAAILALAAAAFSLWSRERLVVAVVFGMIIPSLAFVSTEMLLGQLARIRRAGQYCRSLEETFQELLASLAKEGPQAVSLSSPPMRWETWLDGSPGQKRRFSWIYAFAVAFFAVVTAASLVVYGISLLQWPAVRERIAGLWLGEASDYALTVVVLLPFLVEVLKVRLWLAQAALITSPDNLPGFVLRDL